MLAVHSLAVGPFQSNCHIVLNPETQEAIVFDPGDDGDRILEKLESLGAKTVAIWLTHAHCDHIGALTQVAEATRAPVSIHPLEKHWLADPGKNLSLMLGIPVTAPAADEFWEDGDERELLGVRWRILHTPGHSPGHVVAICEAEDLCICGDLIFQGSMGRVDLPGADPYQMVASLEKFLHLPASLTLYPGHGPSTDLGRELTDNRTVLMFLERI